MIATMKPVDPTRILTRQEIAAVLAELRRKRRWVNTRMNLVIFRLATCCGLRVSEIVGINLGNVKVGGKRPFIQIPKSIGKRGKSRRVPLWWDAGTLKDLTAWKKERVEQGATPSDPYACAQASHAFGKRLTTRNVQGRFKRMIRILGDDRVSTLSIHAGRHSFCSHSLDGGRNVAEVRDAAGHSTVSVTSIYLHAIMDEDESVGDLFDF